MHTLSGELRLAVFYLSGEFKMATAGSPGPWRGDKNRNEDHLTLDSDQNRRTTDLWNIARAAQSDLDRVMKEIERASAGKGAKLEGIENSLKGIESLRRKAAGAVAEGKSIDAALKKMEDLNRYTLTFDPDNYADGTENAYARLREAGYSNVSEDNTWDDPAYKGLNTVWRHQDTGAKAEVQFHTPDSFKAKTETHELYELKRSKFYAQGRDPEEYGKYKDGINYLQNNAYKNVQTPPGQERLGNRVIRSELNPNVDPAILQEIRTDEAKLKAKNAATAAKSDNARDGGDDDDPDGPGAGGGNTGPPRGPKPIGGGPKDAKDPSGQGNKPRGAASRGDSKVPRGQGIGARIAGAAGGAAMLAGGLTGAAGMLPELVSALSNPAAVMQGLAGQAPGMAAEMLAGTELPDRSPKGQMPAGGTPVQTGPASAANASTDAVKKSTDAAKASTDAMKKSTAAMKGSSDGMKTLSAELSKSVGIQKSAASATDGMSKSQKGLNSSMRQNPLMTIVSLIGLVIGAVTLLVQNWDKVKAGFDWVYKNILTPVGKWFSDIWSGTVVPMFQSSVESVSGFFRGMGDTVKDIWDGIVNKIRDVVRIIAGLIEKLPNISIGGVSTESVAQSLRAFSDPQRKKDGGVLDGPGGPRDDVIPVLASKGEFIVNAASTSQNLDLLERINSGVVPRFADGGLVSYSSWSEWAGGSAQSAANGFFFGSDEVPSGDKRPGGVAGDLIGGMAGLAGAAGSFASGMIGDALGVFGADGVPPLVQGLVLANNELVAHEKRITDATTAAAEKADEPAETEPTGETAAEPAKSGLPSKALALIEFAKGVEGKPYVWGGMNWGDCSGAVAALANYVAGMEPFGSRFYTGNEREELSKRGAKYGLGSTGSLNIGWYHNGGGDGHTAATLPNGVNFEMGGGRGNGQYGGSAAGANSKLFDHHAHFPAEMFLAAGGYVSGSGSSIGDMIPSVLRTGDFVVNARSTDANRSLLDVINQGASALSNLVAPIAVPGHALTGSSDEPGKSLDQSMTIHLATPDLDTAFQKAKTWEAQRALTYAGRW
ncbi:hypothetical protein AB0L62_28030 [Nocardia asteroides]|uniref:hypothetical protein n=1 Tax=Nocardia asteroides TaxID=1824 RepID=UPI00341302F9